MSEPRNRAYLIGLKEKMEELEEQTKMLSRSLSKEKSALKRVTKEFTGVWKTNCTKVELQDKMIVLEEKISKLSVEHVASKNSLAHAQQQVIKLTNEIAPISSLPHDVLGAIFQHGREMMTKFDIWLDNEKPLEVLVTHVIRRWRDIANCTPLLWNDLHIVLENYRRRKEEMIELYLERSQKCPLDIRFSLFEYPYFGNDDWASDEYLSEARVLLHGSYDLILPHISRWRRLSINCQYHGALYAVLSPLRNLSASSLEYLSIKMNDRDEAYHYGKEFSIFAGGAPLLKVVELINIRLEHCRPPVQSVTTLQLTATGELEDYDGSNEQISFDPLSGAEFEEMVASLPSLKNLTLHGLFLRPAAAEHIALRLPSLVSLEIHWNEQLYNFCTAFVTPALERLKINGLDDAKTPGHPISILQSPSLSPLYPALRSLEFLQTSLPDNINKNFIHSFPNIVDLTLILSNENAILNILLLDSAVNKFWSHLQTLTLGKVDMDLLCSFIEARISIEHPISCVHLGEYFLRTLPDQPKLRLTKLVRVEQFNDESIRWIY